MVDDKLDVEKVKGLLAGLLKDVTEPAQVKFRVLNKQIKKEFGRGMFLPHLSALVKALRPELAKPDRKAGRRGGARPGPKPKRRGRKPGPKPGRRPGRPAASIGAFLLKIGRALTIVASRDRVQAVVDKHVGSGQSLAKLKVYALSPVGVVTQVVLE